MAILEHSRYRQLAGVPAVPSLGQVYTDTVSGVSYFWNGAAWQAQTAAAVVPSTDVPFAAGNFSGSGAMTWTVGAPNQLAYTYLDFAAPTKAMLITVWISASVVGGIISTFLQVTLPAARTARGYVLSMGYARQTAVPSFAIAAYVVPGSALIEIQGLLNATGGNPWVLDPAGGTTVTFQIMVPYN
jgi:hypothetical protein